MKVFKFGGASVRNPEAIQNLIKIVEKAERDLIIVVSALDKTTNALEEVVNARYNEQDEYLEMFQKVYDYHNSVIGDLGLAGSEITEFMTATYDSTREYLFNTEAEKYDFDYDQVVSVGELWSSRIIAAYMNLAGIKCKWVDIREVLITDSRYRDANILWDKSEINVKSNFEANGNHIYLTQGFIGGCENDLTTTLGREGSDYTAAVLANMTDSTELQVWKDVPGILNADPKWLDDAVVLEYLSYREAVEMSFSGAKVLHPKTIKPLQNKDIPLIVRSFIDEGIKGTLIAADESRITELPVFIRKQDQILISISSLDFSFAIGDNIARILSVFYEYGIKANMVQASAVSIAVCADDDGRRIRKLIESLGEEYRVVYNTGVEMLTIRQYSDEAIGKVCNNREILMEQKTRRIVRIVVKSFQV